MACCPQIKFRKITFAGAKIAHTEVVAQARYTLNASASVATPAAVARDTDATHAAHSDNKK